MNASEARTLTEKSYKHGGNTYIQNVYIEIENAAKSGRDCVTVKSSEPRLIKYVIAQLECDGYKVQRNTGYDQRDGGGWDNLDISW